MEIKDESEITVRLLLKLNDGKLRKFYFVKRKGNDFYWGSAFKSATQLIPFEKTNNISIQIPEDLDLREKVSSKFSFHESGRVHHKDLKSNQYLNLAQWQTLNEFNSPKGFFAVICKPISEYELYEKSSPSSGGVLPVIVNLPNIDRISRFYFEFFLSPFKSISNIDTIIDTNVVGMRTLSIGINDRMYLIIRFGKITLESTPPNREIGIFLC